MSTDISIVVPLYNEEESLPELVDWIHRVCQENNLSYEVILVNDGSTDGSWAVVQKIAKENSNVRGISFRRNYGKSAALHEGFRAVKGAVTMTMDADLQDSPDEIPAMYKMIEEDGYDLVSGWKKKRHDPITKTIPTKLYNGMTSWVSGIKLHDANCGLKAYDTKVVKSIEVYGEMHRQIPILAKQAGFKKIGEKVVVHRARKYGVTKFGLERFINGFLDLMSVTFITRFGKKPMHFFGTFGTLCFLMGGFTALYLIVGKLWDIYNNSNFRDVTDQPLFFLALVAMIIGSQLFLAGFIAELISRTSSDRNEYQIEETLGFQEDGLVNN